MTDRMWRDVESFHAKFHITPRFAIPTPLGAFPGATGRERVRHLGEELDELRKACANGDVAKQADALADLIYVALGTALMMGLPWTQVWDAVHAANMRKVDATGPKQVAKPAGWQDPIVDIDAAIAALRAA